MNRAPRSTLVAAVLAAGLGAMFWIPAMPAGRGWFPVPLDDVYIHFDYAKSFGQGHPFEWIAGQGYSSGETAPLLFTALNNQFWSLNLNAPVASLPVVIYQFALSPYSDWQKLAWTGALIITLAVLALSIIARTLAAQGKSS